MKVVINKCFGGYGFSVEAVQWLEEHGFDGEHFRYPAKEYYRNSEDRLREDLEKWRKYNKNSKSIFLTIFSKDGADVLSDSPGPRNHPMLVQCVEEFGSERASGDCGKLEIVEIPDGIEWEIDDYDGMESIHEQHRSWA